MSHITAIRTELAANAAVTALVDTRIYGSKAPHKRDRADGPFVVLTLVSAVPDATHSGLPSELMEDARVQVDCYSDDYDEAEDVFAAVDDVLGALARPDFAAVRDTRRDLWEDETHLHRVSVDYLVLRGRD